MYNDDDNINYIEDIIYNTYLENYKHKIEKTHNPKNKKIYNIDRLKIEYLTIILPFKLDKVELKKRKNQTFGVFTKQKILKGELITFYPGDILEYSPDEKENHIVSYTSERFYNQYKGTKPDITVINDNNIYNINDKYLIIGCSYFNNDPNYLGHFINDRSKPNCYFYNLKDLHIAIVALENIDINEELFLSCQS